MRDRGGQGGRETNNSCICGYPFLPPVITEHLLDGDGEIHLHLIRLTRMVYGERRIIFQRLVEPFGIIEPEVPPQILCRIKHRFIMARLIAKICEVHLIGGSPCPAGARARRKGGCAASSQSPLLCPRCSLQTRILAAIVDPGEMKRILRHLVKIGRPHLGRQPLRPEHGVPCGGETARASRVGSINGKLIRRGPSL